MAKPCGRAQAGGVTHAVSVVAAAAVADASAPAVVSAWLAASARLLDSSAGLRGSPPVLVCPLLPARLPPFMISKALSEAHSIERQDFTQFIQNMSCAALH